MSLKDILITSDFSISQTMNKLSVSAAKCLLVVDNNNKLLGTITDGDLRRSLLDGLGVDSPIEPIYCRNPQIAVSNDHDVDHIKKLMLSHKIELVPIVDNDNTVKDYYTWSSLFGEQEKNSLDKFDIHVVIMAGGKGERLKPFTNILPKPLVPINDRPIIVHIIDKFLQYGIHNFHLMLNYKSRIIRAFFEDEDFDYNLNYEYEDKPLGTAGSLRYLYGKISSPLVVTNCDIIVDANYYDIYEYHIENKNEITLVSSAKNHTIPYGVCALNGDGSLSHITEKPSSDYLINVGYYILNPKILSLIPKDSFYNMTDLIEQSLLKNYKIGVYTIGENDWIDVGQWQEYSKAIEIL